MILVYLNVSNFIFWFRFAFKKLENGYSLNIKPTKQSIKIAFLYIIFKRWLCLVRFIKNNNTLSRLYWSKNNNFRIDQKEIKNKIKHKILLILILSSFLRMLPIDKLNLSISKCQFWNNSFGLKLTIFKRTYLIKIKIFFRINKVKLYTIN